MACVKCEMLQAFEDCTSIMFASVTVKTSNGTKLHLEVFNQVLNGHPMIYPNLPYSSHHHSLCTIEMV